MELYPTYHHAFHQTKDRERDDTRWRERDTQREVKEVMRSAGEGKFRGITLTHFDPVQGWLLGSCAPADGGPSFRLLVEIGKGYPVTEPPRVLFPNHHGTPLEAKLDALRAATNNEVAVYQRTKGRCLEDCLAYVSRTLCGGAPTQHFHKNPSLATALESLQGITPPTFQASLQLSPTPPSTAPPPTSTPQNMLFDLSTIGSALPPPSHSQTSQTFSSSGGPAPTTHLLPSQLQHQTYLQHHLHPMNSPLITAGSSLGLSRNTSFGSAGLGTGFGHYVDVSGQIATTTSAPPPSFSTGGSSNSGFVLGASPSQTSSRPENLTLSILIPRSRRRERRRSARRRASSSSSGMAGLGSPRPAAIEITNNAPLSPRSPIAASKLTSVSSPTAVRARSGSRSSWVDVGVKPSAFSQEATIKTTATLSTTQHSPTSLQDSPKNNAQGEAETTRLAANSARALLARRGCGAVFGGGLKLVVFYGLNEAELDASEGSESESEDARGGGVNQEGSGGGVSGRGTPTNRDGEMDDDDIASEVIFEEEDQAAIWGRGVMKPHHRHSIDAGTADMLRTSGWDSDSSERGSESDAVDRRVDSATRVAILELGDIDPLARDLGYVFRGDPLAFEWNARAALREGLTHAHLAWKLSRLFVEAHEACYGEEREFVSRESLSHLCSALVKERDIQTLACLSVCISISLQGGGTGASGSLGGNGNEIEKDKDNKDEKELVPLLSRHQQEMRDQYWTFLQQRREFERRCEFEFAEKRKMPYNAMFKNWADLMEVAGGECAVCRVILHGGDIVSSCVRCLHGGHVEHLANWFAHEAQCPAACGCSCTGLLNTQASLLPPFVSVEHDSKGQILT